MNSIIGYLLDYFVKNVPLSNNIVVVSPNSESIAKARKFQLGLRKAFDKASIKMAAFFPVESTSGPVDPNKLSLLTGDKTDLSVSIDIYKKKLFPCINIVILNPGARCRCNNRGRFSGQRIDSLGPCK
jgi:hypothetical protein